MKWDSFSKNGWKGSYLRKDEQETIGRIRAGANFIYSLLEVLILGYAVDWVLLFGGEFRVRSNMMITI